MNRMILLGLGVVALMALGRKKSGNGNGLTFDRGDDDDDAPDRSPDLVIPMSNPGLPHAGSFYPVSDADLEVDGHPLEGIAAQIVGPPNAIQYARCMGRGDWNRYYFGVEDESDLAVDGMLAELAFDKVNTNMRAALERGEWPIKPVAGGPLLPPTQRNFLGVIWLPGVQKTQLQAGAESISCPDDQLDPPQVVLDELTGLVPSWYSQAESSGGLSL